MIKEIKPCIIVLLSVILFMLVGCQNSQVVYPMDSEGFTVLFDGKDLSGWTTETGDWRVENGTVVVKNNCDHVMKNSSYLFTRQRYGDFVLELDYKLPFGPVYGSKGRGANSGVFIRVRDRADPVQTGIEVQVTNTSGGSIYDLVRAKVNMNKPGEWNHYRITCRGSLIAVELNGKETASADLNEWTTARKNPDGTPNKFHRALKDFARRGYIGLQDHGTPVSFRNIRVKALDR
jgi:uncharacterized lipoprotein NlpE involved in copper resistance